MYYYPYLRITENLFIDNTLIYFSLIKLHAFILLNLL